MMDIIHKDNGLKRAAGYLWSCCCVTHLYGWLFVEQEGPILLFQLLYMNAAESFSRDSAETE